MDDIFRQIMLTGGDKYFIAVDGIRAVIIFHGSGGQVADVRAGLRLCQDHGTGPLAGIHFTQKHFLLLIRAENFDHFGRPVGGISECAEGKICAHDILSRCLGDGMRHSLPPDFRILGHGDPFALAHQLIGAVKTFRHLHLIVLKNQAHPVAFLI